MEPTSLFDRDDQLAADGYVSNIRFLIHIIRII